LREQIFSSLTINIYKNFRDSQDKNGTKAVSDEFEKFVEEAHRNPFLAMVDITGRIPDCHKYKPRHLPEEASALS